MIPRLLVVLFGVVNAVPKLTQDMISTLESFRISEQGIDILKRFSANGCPTKCNNVAHLEKIFGLTKNATSRREKDEIRKKIWKEFHPDKLGQYLEGDLKDIVYNFVSGFVNSAKEFCSVHITQRNTREEEMREKKYQFDEEEYNRKRQQFKKEIEESQRQFDQAMEESKKERQRKHEEFESKIRQQKQELQEEQKRQEQKRQEKIEEQKRRLDEKEKIEEQKRQEKMRREKLYLEEKEKEEQQLRAGLEKIEREHKEMKLKREAQRLAEDKAIHEAGVKARKEASQEREREDTSGAEPSMMIRVANTAQFVKRNFYRIWS